MRKILFFSLFLAVPAAAAVPNRITYQGRLIKSGITAAGPHTFIVHFVSGGSSILAFQQSVTLPATGDFTLLIDVPSTVHFFDNAYQLQLTVDGNALSPPDDFTAVPYALVAGTATAVLDGSITSAKIADGAVATAKLPDGAVTDAKIATAAGIAPSKIALSGTATLADWRNPADQTKIAPTAVSGKALVSTPTATQVITPTDPAISPILTLKPQTGATPSTVDALRVETPSGTSVMSVKGDGTVLAKSLAVAGEVDAGASLQTFIRTNGAGASEIGGAAGSNYTALFSKGAEAIRVDSTGKVGVGTTNPSQTLTVNGTFSYSMTQNNMTSSRAIATVYQNTTGRIMYVTVLTTSNNGTAYAYCDNNPSPTTLVSICSTLSFYNRTNFFIVVPGNYYKVTTDSGGSLMSWIEWY